MYGVVIYPLGIDHTVKRGDMKKMNIKEFHTASTHQHEGNLKATARHLGYKLTGKMDECFACAEAKAKRKKIPKKAEGKEEDGFR